MATSSSINKYLGNGRIKSIYCYGDGYVEHNGKILDEYYQDEEKLDALLALGDISFLQPDPGNPPEEHSWENPVDGYVVAYHRDRGEKIRKARFTTFENVEGMYSYNYFWVMGNWYYTKAGKRGVYDMQNNLIFQDVNELAQEADLDFGAPPLEESTETVVKESKKIRLITEQINRKVKR